MMGAYYLYTQNAVWYMYLCAKNIKEHTLLPIESTLLYKNVSGTDTIICTLIQVATMLHCLKSSTHGEFTATAPIHTVHEVVLKSYFQETAFS